MHKNVNLFTFVFVSFCEVRVCVLFFFCFFKLQLLFYWPHWQELLPVRPVPPNMSIFVGG